MSWSAALDGADVPVLVGPTAVGKTQVAVALARHWPLEVISADSRQIYAGLMIGTAAPSEAERNIVPHHGVGHIIPGERYSAGRFARDAAGWVAQIRARDRLPVVVGGTGLYVRALAEGLFHEPRLDAGRRRALDAFLARLEPLELIRWSTRLDPVFAGGGRQRATRAVEIAVLTGRPLHHWQRAAAVSGGIRPWYAVLTLPRPVLHQRIAARAEAMARLGLFDEVRQVLAAGTAPVAAGMDAVGIREAVDVLAGRRTAANAIRAMTIATRQYAKRQETWFRHQLPEPKIMLDATRPPAEIAAELADRWRAHLPKRTG